MQFNVSPKPDLLVPSRMRIRRCLSLAVLLGGAVYAATPPDPALEPGRLPQSFLSGGPDCLTIPDWQVHAYNDDFYILRESGCINYEKPFLYLIFGRDRALLEDTGAGDVQTAPEVLKLVAQWSNKRNRAPVPLVVIHSHAHGDHVAGDKQFQGLANVQFIAPTAEAVSETAHIAHWPAESGSIDLGDRMIDVIPVPGHNAASIALYDRRTGNLLTGDSLYPGRLYLADTDLAIYAASAARLAAFVKAHPVAHVLGTHIEQSRTPYVDYPTGTAYQPEEHSLELTRAHVLELNDAFIGMNGKAEKVALPDFTIVPRTARRKPAQ